LTPPSIESRIDDLYKAPLREFVPERTALAKTLSGAEARRVRRLPKPAVVPWAVNQVYWRARSDYDRVKKSGEKLRSAQLAALKTTNRGDDVRKAGDAHREALRQAVATALKLAQQAGVHPNADTLTQTFEALSLATSLPDAPGRLTSPLQPAGFEALAGVSIPARAVATRTRTAHGAAAPTHEQGPSPAVSERERLLRSAATGVEPRDNRQPAAAVGRHRGGESAARIAARQRDRESALRIASKRRARESAALERRRARESAALERRRHKALEKAEALALRARSREKLARTAWERAKQDLDSAEHTLTKLRAESKLPTESRE